MNGTSASSIVKNIRKGLIVAAFVVVGPAAIGCYWMAVAAVVGLLQ